MRVMAIDYGERRTGLAVTDELGITAQGLDTVVVKDEKDLPDIIARIAGERNVGSILLGLPLNMDGSEGEKCEKVRAFASALKEKLDIPVVFWDERMTSMQAQNVMRELNMKTRGKKQEIDRIAATLMLQEYMKTV